LASVAERIDVALSATSILRSPPCVSEAESIVATGATMLCRIASGGTTAVHGRGYVRRELRRRPEFPLDLTPHLMDEPDPARMPLCLDRGGDSVEKGGTGSGSYRSRQVNQQVHLFVAETERHPTPRPFRHPARESAPIDAGGASFGRCISPQRARLAGKAQFWSFSVRFCPKTRAQPF
jgi:hypothetical protein